ncbi:band 7 protein [Cystobacter fuscus DSM 2262]|uniref:Band 7 protein n=1 Tax=Cystobacter fuscus (strain ATCC 25194 / DSM 2262 / NBRC 100088 / M29) TaxID=1242864 RepID=S9QHR0_CYSF2|nr:SPFH domain-containing protein [Cystobacter fuscus]EPX60824.1 band 7 protein [Cystobacter fuscus DSM 2262]
MFLMGILMGATVYGAYVLSRCFFRVEEGHLSVLTALGAARTESDGKTLRTWGPGLHRKLPWEKAHDIPMMEQALELAGEKGGQTAMTGDGTVLRFDSTLRYVPVRDSLGHFLFGLRAPVEHITGLFSCLLRNEIANFHAPAAGPETVSGALAATHQTGENSYALIRRERRLLSQRIEAFCHKEIGRKYGVQFVGVDLTDVLPPDELDSALNAVIAAQNESDAAYARAGAECQQRVLAAARGVEIARARAAATETEILKLGEFLSELDRQNTLHLYVSRRRSEVMSESRTVYLKGQ